MKARILIRVALLMGHFVSSAQSSRNEMCPLLLVVNLELINTFRRKAFGCCSELRSSKCDFKLQEQQSKMLCGGL